MTLHEFAPGPDDILDEVDRGVRDLHDGGLEPRFIVLGPTAYARLREAIAARFGRSAGYFEQYQYLTVVVDPGRGDRLCILPAPREAAEGLALEPR